MMRLTETSNLAHLSFDSFTEAIAFAHAHHTDPDARDCVIGDFKFTKTSNYAQAHQLATAGWSAGRANIERLAATLITPARMPQPECVFDVSGEGGCDIGRALAGHPKCVFDWRESERVAQAVNGPVVRIAFNTSASGDIDAATIEYRGAAILSLVDALEAAGRRVELVAEKVNGNSGGRGDFRITVPLKLADTQAQPDQIAFALVHPSMNRRVMFSLVAQCGRIGRQSARDGMGSATQYRPTDCDVWIPRLDHSNGSCFTSAGAARAWVIARLREQGIEIEAEAA